MNMSLKRFMVVNAVLVVIITGFLAVSLVGVSASKSFAAEGASAEGAQPGEPAKLPERAAVAAFWAAALATGVSCIAAGIAVGMTGSAAIAAVAERPEIMGRTILFVVFGEGLAIYGVVIAIIILTKV